MTTTQDMQSQKGILDKIKSMELAAVENGGKLWWCISSRTPSGIRATFIGERAIKIPTQFVAREVSIRD